jgi:hypothetical protein
MRLSRLLYVLALAGSACGSSFPNPGAAEVGALRVRDPGVGLADLERGRALYLGKCGGCHLLIEPARFSPDAWPPKIERMQSEGKVRLASAELKDIERYLVSVSAAR